MTEVTLPGLKYDLKVFLISLLIPIFLAKDQHFTALQVTIISQQNFFSENYFQKCY